MPNNGWRPSRCRRCHRPATARRVISTRGLCRACAESAVTESIEQMARQEGPIAERWQAEHARGIEAYLRRIQQTQAS